MHSEVTHAFEKYVSARLCFVDFRSECLECKKCTQGYHNQIFVDKKERKNNNF